MRGQLAQGGVLEDGRKGHLQPQVLLDLESTSPVRSRTSNGMRIASAGSRRLTIYDLHKAQPGCTGMRKWKI